MVTVTVKCGDLTDDIILSHKGLAEDCYSLSPEDNSPLARRGWILQERLLSRRVLYFGTRGMYLECFKNVRFESCHYPTKWDIQANSIITKAVVDQLGSRRKRLSYWYHLVTHYSELLLTKSTDRLPALSGIASQFHRATKEDYIAGIWQGDIARGLAWYTPYYVLTEEPPRVSGWDYLSPSWSWAAAKYGVQFPDYVSEFLSRVDILEATVTTSSLDPFGRVDGGYIKLRGKTQIGVIRELPDSLVRGRRTLYVYSRDLPGEKLGRFEPDDRCYVPGSEFSVRLLYLGKFKRAREHEDEPGVALAVEPVHRRIDVYKRIGMVHGDTLHRGAPNGLEGFFQGSREICLTLC